MEMSVLREPEEAPSSQGISQSIRGDSEENLITLCSDCRLTLHGSHL